MEKLKFTGAVRKVDELGRITIPKSVRKDLNIEVGDCMEIYSDKSSVIIRKYEPLCQMCKSKEYYYEVKGIRLCKSCIANIKKLF